MKESLKTVKKHFIESFEEFFEEFFVIPNLFEKVCVLVMLIYTVIFGTAAIVTPILLYTNCNVSEFVFLSFIVTIPIEVVLIGAVAIWVVKVYQE